MFAEAGLYLIMVLNKRRLGMNNEQTGQLLAALSRREQEIAESSRNILWNVG